MDQRSSATLRSLTDDERRVIADLDLRQIATSNSWISIEDEFRLAEASGIEAERLAKVKRHAAWIADRFMRKTQMAGKINCDDSAFDPRSWKTRSEAAWVLGRAPQNPLDEAGQYTTTADFALLCPTCHRIEHIRLRLQRRNSKAARKTT